MKWVTWDQAAITALLCFAVAMLLRRLPTTKWRTRIVPVTTELSLISALYTLWRLALKLPLDQPIGAIERARQIDRFQHWLHMPAELSLQQFVLRYDWLAQATNFYYAVFHVPAMSLFLVWIFIRHRDKYPRWRSSLAMLTAACLVIRYTCCPAALSARTGIHRSCNPLRAIGLRASWYRCFRSICGNAVDSCWLGGNCFVWHRVFIH